MKPLPEILLLLSWSLLGIVTSQSTGDYLLSAKVLEYMDVVAILQEEVSDPDLPDNIARIASDLGFSRLSYYWEAPFNAGRDEFAQVALGLKGNACYAVFHALAIEEDFRFVPNPYPLDNLKRSNCDTATEECSCRVHWLFVDMSFPQYWQEVHEQLDSCMSQCLARNDECDMVLGGHGAGGSVASLLSLRYASADFDPYVISAGAPNVLYDNCEGINEDRYIRVINTDNTGGGNLLSEVFYFYGICFDNVPFIGADELVGIGHTIGMGPEKDGMAISLSGTGQLVTLQEGATRTSLCRSAHNLLAYRQKMQSAVSRNPMGVTPVGFNNLQYCEVDQDCRTASRCASKGDDYPTCTAAEPSPQPTLPPASANPTIGPTARPTTASPVTPSPSRKPTQPPKTQTYSPTRYPTRNPSARPTRLPTSLPTLRSPANSTPLPTTPPFSTLFPTSTTAPSFSDENDNHQGSLSVPTVAATSESPTTEEVATNITAAPTEVMNTLQPTEDEMNATAATWSPSTLSVTTKAPAEYDSNEDGTLAPTQQPVNTPPPTLSASDLPLFDAFFRTTLVLRDVTEELTGFTVFLWEDETSDHILRWIEGHTKENNWDPPILQLRVQTNIVSQSVLFVETVDATDREEESTIASNVMKAIEVEEQPKAEKSRRSHRSPKGKRKRVRQRRRKVQSTNPESLKIVFEIAIAYRTLNVQVLDLHGLILEAFQSGDGRNQYYKRLKDSRDPAFGTMSDFVLQIQESPTNGVALPNGVEKEEDKTLFWVLIGSAAAAVVLSIGLFFWYWQRVSSRGEKLEDSTSSGNGLLEKAIFEPASASNPRLSPDGTKVPRLSQEIVVDESHDDGISTLGDPTFYHGATPVALLDEQTASVNYAHNYLNMHDKYDDNNRTFQSDQQSSDRSAMRHTLSSASALSLSKVGSGLSNLNDSAIFSDDNSFEEQFARQDECFEVKAPPGKLGIIIDLSDIGEPIVRAIRGDSVLADEVKIGDRLLSVDGEGCTDMSAEHVSKLIAVKSNQGCRKIMLVRRSKDYM